MIRDPYKEEEVAEGVWQISGSHDWGAGVNAAVLVSGTHAVVVDNLYRPGDARLMFKRIQSWGIESRALVNTHWHTDHNIGNCLFSCPIWAHVTGPRLLKRYWPKWVGDPRDKRAGGLRLKLPDQLFDRRVSLDLDGSEIQLIHVPGHTTDSIGVFLPDSRIFIAGDTVMDLPFILFGDSREEIRSLRRIQRLRPRMILQGHGPPCNGARLDGDVRYLERLWEKAREARRAGLTRKQFLETPLERVLPNRRCQALVEGYREAHRNNLWKIWNEMSSAR
ncbi:MAG: MBL fold metallo-hydrolase [Thermoplasmata archaeon]